MTQEEKQLLINDLFARLPYGIKVRLEGKPRIVFGVQETLIIVRARSEKGGWEWDKYDIEEWNIKPYLRPMSSMIGKELDECRATCKYRQTGQSVLDCATPQTIDYLISHHFDYRELIPMGLALEAPEGMYKTE